MTQGPSPAQEAFWRHRPVAVTGATGFLGTHLVAQLLARGAAVTILQRDDVPQGSVRAAWAHRVAVVRGSVEDQALCERLLAEYEIRTVFHLAAQTQVGVANGNPISTFASNITGTWALLEATRRSPRVEQVVVASSDKAYGDQPELPYHEAMPLRAVHPYDVSKACADLIAGSYHATWGLPVCVTRCGNFFGPGDSNWERLVPGTARAVLEGRRPTIRSDGSLVRDYLYVVDGALAYLRVAEAMAEDPAVIGQAFNFSTEQPLAVLDLVSLIQEAAGTSFKPDIRASARSEIQAQHLSAEKARTMLGWAPTYSLPEALAISVDWYREELARVAAADSDHHPPR